MELTLNEMLLKEIECYYCPRQLVPPLFKCSFGHHFCNECVKSEEKCSECQLPTKRDYLIEELCFGTTLNCSSAKSGCDFKAKTLLVSEHEKFCSFSQAVEKSPGHTSNTNQPGTSEENIIAKGYPGQSLEQAVIAALECPICYRRISPSVTECENGHRICHDCFQKVDNCPLCRCVKLTSFNLFLGRIFKQLELPCNNVSSGCQFYGNGLLVVGHENSCEFETVSCPFFINGLCTWRGLRADVVDHCRNNHSAAFSCKSKQEWLMRDFVSDGGSYCALHYVHGNLFKHCWARKGNDITFSIGSLGNKHRGKQISYELTITSNTVENRKLFLSEVWSKLTFNYDKLRDFRMNNNNLIYTIRIDVH